jgi:hypothetical protein
MESAIQAITAIAAVALAIAALLFTVQFALWRALRSDGVDDAPPFLTEGRGLMPTALIGAGAVAVIALLQA